MSYIRSELQNQRITYSTPLIPVEGGYDTVIYRFQLEGPSDELAEPLILRVFAGSSPNRASFEGLVQEAIASLGYPAPKVHFTCTDEDVLGAEGHLAWSDPEIGDRLSGYFQEKTGISIEIAEG